MASLPPPAAEGEEVVQPRKLGRLRRAGAEENTQPNAAEAPSPARPAAREKDRLHEGEADRQPSSPAASGEPEREEAAGDDAAGAGEAASPSKASRGPGQALLPLRKPLHIS